MATREEIEKAIDIIKNDRRLTYMIPYEVMAEKEALFAYLMRDYRGYLKPNTLFEGTPLSVFKSMRKNRVPINLSTQSFNFNNLDLEKAYYILSCVENLSGNYDSLFRRAVIENCDYMIDFLLNKNLVSKDILPIEMKRAAQLEKYKSLKAILGKIND